MSREENAEAQSSDCQKIEIEFRGDLIGRAVPLGQRLQDPPGRVGDGDHAVVAKAPQRTLNLAKVRPASRYRTLLENCGPFAEPDSADAVQ
jgi:hypothetical protein